MRKAIVTAAFVLITLPSCSTLPTESTSEPRLHHDARVALANLYQTTPAAEALGKKARAILVFPKIIKGGFVVGGLFGEGVLLEGGRVAGHYNTAAASYGLQAGLQKYGYALFFMSAADLDYLYRSGGWELGVGPSVTVIDTGLARSLTTTTAREGVYAFFFSQHGLMAGLGLQGAKIWKVE